MSLYYPKILSSKLLFVIRVYYHRNDHTPRIACLACGWHTRWRGLLAQLTLLCVCKKTRSRHRDRVRDDDDDVIAASFIITDKRAGTVFRDWGRADDNRYLRKQSLKPLGAVDLIAVDHRGVVIRTESRKATKPRTRVWRTMKPHVAIEPPTKINYQ